MPTLGEVIAKLREDAGLSRMALAKAAHIDPSILARLEYGEREEVRLENLCRLADVLGVSLDDLAAAAGYRARKRAGSLAGAPEVARLRSAMAKIQSIAEAAIETHPVPSQRKKSRSGPR